MDGSGTKEEWSLDGKACNADRKKRYHSKNSNIEQIETKTARRRGCCDIDADDYYEYVATVLMTFTSEKSRRLLLFVCYSQPPLYETAVNKTNRSLRPLRVTPYFIIYMHHDGIRC